MTFTLRRGLSFPLGYKRPAWCGWPIAPDGSRLGLSAGPAALAVLDTARPDTPLMKVPLPPDSLAIAASPAGGPIAVLTRKQIQLIDDGGLPVAQKELPRDWGTPKALSYDRTGKFLCLSTESHEEGNRLRLLTAGGLAPLNQLRLEGGKGSGHYLNWHPNRNLLALSVACGQDGIGLNLVEVSDQGLRSLGTKSFGEAFGLGGFSTDGATLAGCGDTRLLLWSVPDLETEVEMRLEEDTCSDYAGVFHRGLLLVTADTGDEQPQLLIHDGATLTELGKLPLPRPSQSNYVVPGPIVVTETHSGMQLSHVQGFTA